MAKVPVNTTVPVDPATSLTVLFKDVAQQLDAIFGEGWSEANPVTVSRFIAVEMSRRSMLEQARLAAAVVLVAATLSEGSGAVNVSLVQPSHVEPT